MKSWTCPKCNLRLAIRPKTEDESRFAKRVLAHRRSSLCRCRALQRKLYSSGMAALDPSYRQYLDSVSVLRDAGLVQRHRTSITARFGGGRVVGHWLAEEDWAPRWAIRFERYLASTDNHAQRRAYTIRKTAAEPDGVQRAESLMALAGVGP